MSLSQLYSETIKQHCQFPVGKGLEFTITHSAEGYNASCGDELNLYFQLSENGQIDEIGFNADACAICTASTSLLCLHSQQKTIDQIEQDIQQVCSAINLGNTLPIALLDCLSAVSKHKSRINCALLPWQTFAKALNNSVHQLETTPFSASSVHG